MLHFLNCHGEWYMVLAAIPVLGYYLPALAALLMAPQATLLRLRNPHKSSR